MIVASAPPSMKKAVFTFMNEQAIEVSKVIEEGGGVLYDRRCGLTAQRGIFGE